MNTFGKNLRAIRKLNKISQKEFADKMNTTQQRVSEWEFRFPRLNLKFLMIFALDFALIILSDKVKTK